MDVDRIQQILYEACEPGMPATGETLEALKSFAAHLTAGSPACFKCKYWVQAEHAKWFEWPTHDLIRAIENRNLPIEWDGQCRRFPPPGSIFIGLNNVPIEAATTAWDYWCGEFAN